ncbi:hypothetical protein PoB_004360400 [Plakobranchus ocellatus]|uniref:Uncharacterized protein n=1 Tax=Plakobranchus ocellatus TaxID=259542 RepID=A0AAV4BFH3_9GAST|nr:hypothetical protein PoB_004360400 [Plakobranchus ocellatus]
MANNKRVQALLKRLSCIPLVNRFRRDDADEAATGGNGTNAGAGDSSEGAAAASGSGNSNNNNSTGGKKLPKPGSGRKPKKQKSFSDLDKGSKSGQHALVYRCGLTVRQVFSIKQSWKAIMREDAAFGVEMFIR